MVVEMFRYIVEMGSIVIFFVYQFSDRILGFIDNLLILVNGQMIYMGYFKELIVYFIVFNYGYFIFFFYGNVVEFVIDFI